MPTTRFWNEVKGGSRFECTDFNGMRIFAWQVWDRELELEILDVMVNTLARYIVWSNEIYTSITMERAAE